MLYGSLVWPMYNSILCFPDGGPGPAEDVVEEEFAAEMTKGSMSFQSLPSHYSKVHSPWD